MDSSAPFPTSDNSAVWPRRAVKACASCRRDKIRCDGDRPCSGCTKKGFTAEQCIDGCEHCRRARVRCEDGKPCLRCREMKLECVEESAGPPMRQDPSTTRVPTRTQRLKANDRARLACQACRRDNKKCEDQRPCARCITRGEECIHVNRGPKLVKLRCEWCRKENKKCEDNRPCRFCVEEGQECINAIRKGRGHGTRVMAACTNCRRDKIRCEGSRPCPACVRKGYECVDRACKSCTQKGKESECTHRKVYEVGSSDLDDEPTSAVSVDHRFVDMTAQASASSAPAEMHHPLLPPMSYTPYNYYYPPPPHPYPPPHGGPSHLQPPPYHQGGERIVYFPVIDPHLDPPGTSSERRGPDANASGRSNE